MYKSSSPWSQTPILKNKILDIQTKRYIHKDDLDEEYTIPAKYEYRPDLLSYEKYGTAKWWWIFALRNPNEIIDPINDFVAGTVIRIPSKKNIDEMK
jgi:hypothetical protein